jgi:hypothetical protein
MPDQNYARTKETFEKPLVRSTDRTVKDRSSTKRKLIFEVCANCGKKITDDEIAVLVDDDNDLIFCQDSCVKEHFDSDIERLEDEHIALRGSTDIPLEDFAKYENFLPLVLNEPDEIWEIEAEDEAPLAFYIGEFLHENETIFYVAAVYLTAERPSFVYIHFPTRDTKLVEQYRRGELIFDESSSEETSDEPDLMEEEGIGFELYSEMIEHRSDNDIDEEEFPRFISLRQPTIESPEEVWRNVDEEGNAILTFIAHHNFESQIIAYVAVTLEDEVSQETIPIFSFPTVDTKLLERFRTGELLFNSGDF